MSARVSPRESLSAAIRQAAARGSPALVAFMTAGFPTRARFRGDLAAIAASADVVEIGVPFTDPMADGVTIQRSSHAALAQGVSLAWILEELAAMRPVQAPLVLMSYLNPLLAYGLPALVEASLRGRVAGYIVPDLPHDESRELAELLGRHEIALVPMVTPVTRPARLAAICASAQGFVYAVTMTGTTGRNVAVPAGLTGYLDAVRAAAPVPVCAGFGIRSREQVQLLAGHVDGVVIGSALVELLERGEDPGPWLQSLRGGPQAA